MNVPTKTPSPQKSDFPAGLSQPALRALYGAGFTQLKDLTTVSEADVSKLHGMGPKGMRTLQQALKKKGLAFQTVSNTKSKRGKFERE